MITNAKMKQSTKPAAWIIILSCLLSLLGISISISMYIMPPDTFIPGLDPGSPAVTFLNAMCASRQLSIAVCIGFAALNRSAPMLMLSWLCYLLLNIQDAVIGITQHDSGMITGATVISLLAVLILYSLAKVKVNTGDIRKYK